MRRILPVYLAIDVSAGGSESGDRLGSINTAILHLADELAVNPRLADAVRVAIVEFSDSAALVLPLTDLTEVRSIPSLHAHGSRRYRPLFALLQSQVGHDLRVLQRAEDLTLRPLVALMLHGDPVDREWVGAYRSFDTACQPNLVVMTAGNVSDTVTKSLRSIATYHWQRGVAPGRLLTHSVTGLIQSLATSRVVKDGPRFDLTLPAQAGPSLDDLDV